MNPRRLPLTLLFAALAASSVLAQREDGRRERPEREDRGPATPDLHEAPTEPGIAWFGSWEAGLAEAERTGRPILLMSAAPQCHGVPGMW